MEAALLSGSIKVMLPKLTSLVEKTYNRDKDIKKDLESLKKDLRMITSVVGDQLPTQNHLAVLQYWIEDLRELAHGIEDCVDTLVYRATQHQQESYLKKGFRSPKTLITKAQFGEKLRALKQKIVEANERRQRYIIPAGQGSSATRVDESPASASDPGMMDGDLVGIEDLRAKLLEQLAEAAEGQPKQLKVISIVGCWGLGKTALAANVYNTETGKGRFEKHAWVCAGLKPPREVLADLLKKLGSGGPSSQGSRLDTSNVDQLGVYVKKLLEKKRYFIVIDDIQTQEKWATIRSAFPDDNISSRVVVTTTIQSVATSWCSAKGYVHKIRRLDEECSKQLFSRKACLATHLTYSQPDTTAILKKCDGEPLALVTIGEFLKSMGWPDGSYCEEVCSDISHHLETGDSFEDMRQALMRNYSSLKGNDLRACLIYFSMFPSGYPIKKKSLLRRWSAEGILEPQGSWNALKQAARNFHELIDRNLIEPIHVSNNDSVRTCQTYGMTREFILQLSISQNFITLFYDNKKDGEYFRRLCLHHNTTENGDSFKDIDLSLVRSLSIFGKACETVLDFSKYKLLRVLDLEKCDDLKDGHLGGICNLLLLKYLSLGGSVSVLPPDIAKLEHLEVLDVRRTKVRILSVEAFLLPCLMHILGEFRLSGEFYTKTVFLRKKTGTEVQKFLSEGKSKIETLAGFVSDGSEGFLHLMGQMNKLRKVKIWCKPSANSTDWKDLTKAIQRFIQTTKEENNDTTRSLTLHFDECSEDILDSIGGQCYLSSLKLYGNLTMLPLFVVSVQGLRELCLGTTTKLTSGVLETLSSLGYLKYLKLIAHEIEEFIIEVHALPGLVRLCLELQCPTFPTIKQGALPFLVTLQLLCKDLSDLSDINIECFKLLEEVTLHPEVSKETQKEWEKVAKEHPNGPKVLLHKSGDAAQSSNDQPLADFSSMSLSEVSPDLHELTSGILVP